MPSDRMPRYSFTEVFKRYRGNVHQKVALGGERLYTSREGLIGIKVWKRVLMRLQVLSDLHLEFGDYAPEQARADVVILAGDIHVGCKGIQWVKKHFPEQPVIYVIGNHEFYGHSISGVFKEFRTRIEGGNICLLENQSVEIGGFTFLGCTLWTDFKLWPNADTAMLAAGDRMRDFHVIKTPTGLFQPEDSLMMHTASAG